MRGSEVNRHPQPWPRACGCTRATHLRDLSVRAAACFVLQIPLENGSYPAVQEQIPWDQRIQWQL